jgi:hypothetical protein
VGGEGVREGGRARDLTHWSAEDVLDLAILLLELGAHGHGHSLAMAGWIPLHPVSGGSHGGCCSVFSVGSHTG